MHVIHAGIRRISCYRRRALYALYGVRIGTCFFVDLMSTPLQMLRLFAECVANNCKNEAQSPSVLAADHHHNNMDEHGCHYR